MTARRVFSCTTRPLSRTGITSSGCSVCRSSRRSDRPRRRWRTTLTELPVEPAEPPTNISPTSSIRANVVQDVKSALENPVVVVIETTWNTPWRIAASPAASPSAQISATRATEAIARIPRYSLSSWSRAHVAPAAANEAPKDEREVDARDQHEQRDDPLGGGRVADQRARVGHEPSRGKRGQSDRHRLEQAHPVVDSDDAEEGENSCEDDRERDVEEPQPARRRTDSLGQRVDLRARHLRVEELPASDPKPRQDREREHDDPHASDPLRELAPEEERMIDRVHVGQDRCPGRREAGHGLEERVHRAIELRLAGQQVRDRTEHGREQPGERDDEIGLAKADGGRPLADSGEPETGGERDHGGREERPGRLAIGDRDGGRHEGRDAQVLEERPGEAESGPEVDREAWAARCRKPSQIAQSELRGVTGRARRRAHAPTR